MIARCDLAFGVAIRHAAAPQGDHLPGMVCDRYGDVPGPRAVARGQRPRLCVQFPALAAEELLKEEPCASLGTAVAGALGCLAGQRLVLLP